MSYQLKKLPTAWSTSGPTEANNRKPKGTASAASQNAPSARRRRAVVRCVVLVGTLHRGARWAREVRRSAATGARLTVVAGNGGPRSALRTRLRAGVREATLTATMPSVELKRGGGEGGSRRVLGRGVAPGGPRRYPVRE